MATGKFRVKTSNEWNTIFYRFKHSNQFDLECSTGIQVPNTRWSDTKQEVLNTKDIDYKKTNLKLKELDSAIRKEHSKAILNSETINTDWLREKINIFFDRITTNEEVNASVFFTNFILSFIEDSKTKKNKKKHHH